MEDEKISVVREFLGLIDAGAAGDESAVQRVLAILDEDFTYQNHPQRAVHGMEEFGKWYSEFIGDVRMVCDIKRAACAGDWVLTERVDVTTMNGVRMTVPIMGSFEVRSDGKIHTWNDYMPYSEHWRKSGQMRTDFFDDWATEDPIYTPAD